jgi:hypothetical protein
MRSETNTEGMTLGRSMANFPPQIAKEAGQMATDVSCLGGFVVYGKT